MTTTAQTDLEIAKAEAEARFAQAAGRFEISKTEPISISRREEIDRTTAPSYAIIGWIGHQIQIRVTATASTIRTYAGEVIDSGTHAIVTADRISAGGLREQIFRTAHSS